MSTTPRRAAILAPLLLAGLALNGCGVSDDQIRPGVAASVDGSDVTVSDVDDLADGTCTYLDASPDASTYPRVTIRRLFLETLVRREAAERLVADLGATLPADYASTVAGLAQDYTTESPSVARAMREGDEARYYVAYATAAIGNALLRKETGAEPGNAQQISDRGTQAIDQWLAERDVEVNPTYGLSLRDGAFVADDGLSVPVSSEATAADAVADIDLNSATADNQAELQAAIAKANASLPTDQVCGPQKGGAGGNAPVGASPQG